MSELLFRHAIAKLIRANEKVVPTEPLKDTLAAFKIVLKQDVNPDAGLFKEIAMDSLDLTEITIALDGVYGERNWDPLWSMAGERFNIGQYPILTPRMIAEFLQSST